jgi:hypothetical protein
MTEYSGAAVSDVWKKSYEADGTAVRNRSELTAQTEAFSCGAACLVDVIKGFNPNLEITEPEIIEQIREIHESEGRDITTWGTPPEVVKVLLAQHGIPFEESQSEKPAEQIEVEDLQLAQQRLEKALQEGKVCMVCIQSTPDYWYRDENTRKTRIGKPQNPTTSDYQIVRVDRNKWDGVSTPTKAVRSEHGTAASTKDDPTYQGHWIVVTGMMQRDGKDYYITHDPWYQREQDSVNQRAIGLGQPPPIDPKFMGVRLMAKKYFLSHWHDLAGDNETEFNQYLLAVKTGPSE